MCGKADGYVTDTEWSLRPGEEQVLEIESSTVLGRENLYGGSLELGRDSSDVCGSSGSRKLQSSE